MGLEDLRKLRENSNTESLQNAMELAQLSQLPKLMLSLEITAIIATEGTTADEKLALIIDCLERDTAVSENAFMKVAKELGLKSKNVER